MAAGRASCIVIDMLLDIIDHVGSSLWRGRANRKQARKDADLRARGVLAPAVVVSATTHQSRESVDGKYIKIRYVADVYPQGGSPFRAEFTHWSDHHHYTAIMGEIVGEAGKQIWVTFDPSKPDDMMFEYDEEQRVRRWQEADLQARRSAFEAAAKPLEKLRDRGAEAHALIVHVEDLQIAYPGTNGMALQLHVDVTPPAGAPYRTVIPAIVSMASLSKYSVGRRVFVRFDPHDPQRVVFDSDRNRALPV
jgi:hypothetical protein